MAGHANRTSRAGPKRGKNRETVLAEVAELYAQGRSLAYIAERQGVSVAQISYDCKVIRRHWRMSSIRNFDEAVSREVAKIDYLESTYWAAWFRSLEDREEHTTERRDGETASSLARVKRRVGPPGEAVYLGGVQWCIDRRIRLLGLDAPQRVTVEAVRAEAERIAAVSGFSVEEILAEAESVVRATSR